MFFWKYERVYPLSTMITKEKGNRNLPFDEQRLISFINNVVSINSSDFNEKVLRSIKAKDEIKAEQITSLLIKTALENVDEVNTEWSYAAARIYYVICIKKRVKIEHMIKK